ncbi:hypothetical protein K523DRAFT_234779 [Schizophyllum commune Tattone D]|nr:hypothetical protein K523DRAFT_234779 [Schizophyllum commune Tattone D]
MLQLEEAVLQRIRCFYRDHPGSLSVCLSTIPSAKQGHATFADILEDVAESHRVSCGCQRHPNDVWIITQDIRAEPGEFISASLSPLDLHLRLSDPLAPIISAVDRGHHLSIVFSWKDLSISDTESLASSASDDEALLTPPTTDCGGATPCARQHTLAPRTGVLSSDILLRARHLLHQSFDRARYVPLLCSSKRLNVIRRPPGFGRSAFLSTVIDCLDVVSHRRGEERRPRNGCSSFNFNCGLILHLDMGRLSKETYEDLEENVADLLRSAVTHFLDKYQSYIGFSDEERTEVLAQCNPNGSLEDAMASVGLIQKAVFTYVCVDNYTAPYEKARAKDWPQIAAILDRALFRPLMSLVAAEYIDSGLLVGSSEMDEDFMASLTSEKPEVDEWGDDVYDDFPPPVPFAGPLSPFATDWTHDPRMGAAIGVTQEQVVILGRAVLGDEARASALKERVSMVPSQTFSDSPNAEHVWATGRVLEMLRDMDGARMMKEDLHSEIPDGLVAS